MPRRRLRSHAARTTARSRGSAHGRACVLHVAVTQGGAQGAKRPRRARSSNCGRRPVGGVAS